MIDTYKAYKANRPLTTLLKVTQASSAHIAKQIVFITAGRVIAKRIMGNASFFELASQGVTLQIYASSDQTKGYPDFTQVNFGDILEVEGHLFFTKKENTLTLRIANFRTLTTSVKTWPDKFHGLKDCETLRRQRYCLLTLETKDIHPLPLYMFIL